MSCTSELDLNVYVDGAADGRTTVAIDAHLAACATCRARVKRLSQERAFLRAALHAHEEPLPIPPLPALPARRDPARTARRARAPGFGAMAGAFVCASSFGLFVFVESLRGFRFPEPFGWLESLLAAGLTELAVGVAFFFATEGSSMVSTAFNLAGATVVALGALAAAAALARRHGVSAAALSLVALVAFGFVSPADAFEYRQSDQTVIVAADEVIDDTLLAFGETVEIHGTVNGDLIAFARRVVVDGRVQGQIITGAQEVEIRATVGGSVLGGAQTLTFADSDIAQNVYAFGQTVTTRNGVIRGNAALFGARTVINAMVGRDAVGIGADVEVGGAVEGDVTAYAEHVDVRDEARVGGDVVAHVPNEEAVTVAAGATIGGEVRTTVNGGQGEPGAERDEGGVGGWIFGKVLRFASAFIAGCLLLWLVPAVRRLSVDTAGETLTAAGIGLVALVSTPIVALLIAITIIGLPVALVGLALWAIGIYLAKIVVAHFVGRKLLLAAGRDRHFTAALALGLVIVLVVISIPFVGGIANFLLTITGFGMLVIFVGGLLQRRPENGATVAA